jgi:hypothetical protein
MNMRLMGQALMSQGGIGSSLLGAAISPKDKPRDGAMGAKPQFHKGGLVGKKGGEVHEGELVIPKKMVDKMKGKANDVDASGAKGTYGSVTQHAAAERPERPVPTNRERIKHIVVEAHGATNVEHTPEQHTRNHSQATNERSEKHRETKKSSVTLGRHVTSGTRSK